MTEIVVRDLSHIEFNPAVVRKYRLIGIEMRLSANPKQSIDSLRYAPQGNIQSDHITSKTDELAYVKLRYKKPNMNNSILLSKATKHEDQIRPL
ncbi:MAG: DUF3520 domain-containing protein [Pseudomonadales bacterium]|nr:YfbK domain-containing protein [Oleiphilus messinensis]MCG8610325.1 DUF3520 domain-containing protein [Pseudomonadales bacterium]